MGVCYWFQFSIRLGQGLNEFIHFLPCDDNWTAVTEKPTWDVAKHTVLFPALLAHLTVTQDWRTFFKWHLCLYH